MTIKGIGVGEYWVGIFTKPINATNEWNVPGPSLAAYLDFAQFTEVDNGPPNGLTTETKLSGETKIKVVIKQPDDENDWFHEWKVTVRIGEKRYSESLNNWMWQPYTSRDYSFRTIQVNQTQF